MQIAPAKSVLDQSEINRLALAITSRSANCRLGPFVVEAYPLLKDAPQRLVLIQLSAGVQAMQIVAKPQTMHEYHQHCRFQAILQGYPAVRVPEPLGYAHGIGFMEYVPGPTLLEKLLQCQYGYEDTATLSAHLRNVAKLQAYMVMKTQEAATITIRAFLEEQEAAYHFDMFFSGAVQERFSRLFHRFEGRHALDRPFPRSLMHGDFAPRNFIVTPEGLVLIDFMFVRSGLPIWDAVYFYHEISHPDYFTVAPEAAAQFRLLYEEVAPVPIDNELWDLMGVIHTRNMLRHGIQRNLQHFELAQRYVEE